MIYKSYHKVEYTWEGAAWKGGNLLSRTFSWSFDVKTDRVGAGPCRFAIIVSVRSAILPLCFLLRKARHSLTYVREDTPPSVRFTLTNSSSSDFLLSGHSFGGTYDSSYVPPPLLVELGFAYGEFLSPTSHLYAGKAVRSGVVP